jgi:hypothetical protein
VADGTFTVGKPTASHGVEDPEEDGDQGQGAAHQTDDLCEIHVDHLPVLLMASTRIAPAGTPPPETFARR